MGPQGISQRIEVIKKHFNYSNAELGKICEVPDTTIENILNYTNQNPGIRLFIRLSRKLSINIRWLLFNEGLMMSEDAEKIKIMDQSELIEHLQNKTESLEMLLKCKDGEIETLKKIIVLLESRRQERMDKKNVG